MKKFLWLFAATLGLVVGGLYLGAWPTRLHYIVERHASVPVSGVVYGIGQIRGSFTAPQPYPVVFTPKGVMPLPEHVASRPLPDITRRVLYGALALEEEISIPITLPAGDYEEVTSYFMAKVELAVDIIRRDIPQMFWLSLGPYTVEWSGNTLTRSGTLNIRLNYRHTTAQVIGLREQIDEVTQNLLAKAPSDPLQATAFFHDWIIRNTVYACYLADGSTPLAGSEHGFNIDGVFLRGSAVCEGYSKALALLCDLAGIPNVIVYGVAAGEKHSWNLIYLYGHWYLVDPTWNDPAGAEDMLAHTFFLLGSQSVVNGQPVHEIFRPDSAQYPPLSRYGFFERRANN